MILRTNLFHPLASMSLRAPLIYEFPTKIGNIYIHIPLQLESTMNQ